MTDATPETPGREAWSLPPGVTFLNHGSFGLVPQVVQSARAEVLGQIYSDPVNFFVRELEPALWAVQERLGRWLNADPRDFVLVDNATAAMNIVARSVPLSAGDEVLLTDQEYGAVRRIWEKTCQPVGARVTSVSLPVPCQSTDEVIASLRSAITPQTRLLIVSHLTSPTAVILPVAAICREFQSPQLAVCIDGPHALAMLPVDLTAIGADFYCASGHKWVCAPPGSGLLHVSRHWQARLRTPAVSWGGSLRGAPATWQDEFNWWGTRDPSSNLSFPAALDFCEQMGWKLYRERTHALAQRARSLLEEFRADEYLTPDSSEWYGPMVAVPIPIQNVPRPKAGQPDPLSARLWDRYQIEVPITWWRNYRLLRVSCQVYNTEADLQRLVDALRTELA